MTPAEQSQPHGAASNDGSSNSRDGEQDKDKDKDKERGKEGDKQRDVERDKGRAPAPEPHDSIAQTRPPTDREMAWAILQETLPGFEAGTAQAVARQWAEVERYFLELETEPMEVLAGRAKVGLPRPRERRDIAEHPSLSEPAPHSLYARLGKRGRFYQGARPALVPTLCLSAPASLTQALCL